MDTYWTNSSLEKDPSRFLGAFSLPLFAGQIVRFGNKEQHHALCCVVKAGLEQKWFTVLFIIWSLLFIIIIQQFNTPVSLATNKNRHWHHKQLAAFSYYAIWEFRSPHKFSNDFHLPNILGTRF